MTRQELRKRRLAKERFFSRYRMERRFDAVPADDDDDPSWQMPVLALYLQIEPGQVALALYELRQDQRLSISAMAFEADVSKERWRNWEMGYETPSLPELELALQNLRWMWSTMYEGRQSGDPLSLPVMRLWCAFLMRSPRRKGRRKPLPSTRRTERAEAAWSRYNDEREWISTEPDRHLEEIGRRREGSESTLADFLRYRREINESSIEQMAAKAGVRPELWTSWETGTALPSPQEATVLALKLFKSDYLREKFLDLCRQPAA